MQTTHQRQFTFADQTAFAELSGDNNPLHMDPLVARKSLFGEPIVHGVHVLMWALDKYLEGSLAPVRLNHLQVNFSKPIGLNQEVRMTPASGKDNRIRIDILREDEVAVRMFFELAACEPNSGVGTSPDFPEQHVPDFVSNEAIRSCSGSLDLHLQPEMSRRFFPNLNRNFCPVQSAILLGMTRLVGMKCPGLYSIFSELKLTASNTGGLQNIRYSISEFDDRYGRVVMSVAAPGLSGTINAFVRPKPQTQGSFLDLKKLVNDRMFLDQRALIVGGSRGLGEVTAKLLAAGGAEVQVSFRLGKSDARKVVDEIVAGGGSASACELDIFRPQNEWAGFIAPTHLYYFASSLISASGKKYFSPALFKTYCDYYLTGFSAVVENLEKNSLLNVFYPSTVFIDELPSGFIEYAMAKNTGEIMCKALAKKYSQIYFYCPRLPRMATDQTVSLVPTSNPTPNPAPIILAALKNFRDRNNLKEIKID